MALIAQNDFKNTKKSYELVPGIPETFWKSEKSFEPLGLYKLDAFQDKD
jgi:hypothetical protein